VRESGIGGETGETGVRSALPPHGSRADLGTTPNSTRDTLNAAAAYFFYRDLMGKLLTWLCITFDNYTFSWTSSQMELKKHKW
jgi:hypothetical protein